MKRISIHFTALHLKFLLISSLIIAQETMANDIKMYNYMENKLQEINKKFISINEEDRKRNNEILLELIDMVVSKMKEKDGLFKSLYTRIFYGGSFYDGLRVGKPDEFDLDLLLSLPALLKPEITISNIPGFVHVEMKGLEEYKKQPTLVDKYKGIEKLLSDKRNYLDTEKVLKWMESVVTLALNTFPKDGTGYSILKTKKGEFKAKIHKGGPAFTLKASGMVNGNLVEMDIDLVPCFAFGQDKWLTNGFRSNPVPSKPGFFVVPKPLKLEGVTYRARFWRLSFQEQEREIINGKKNLKPTIKLLKKLRDTQNHGQIASYYLKTVLIWQAEKKESTFWDAPLSYVFMTMLKEYSQHLEKGNIPYFWQKSNNLIKSLNLPTLTNFSGKIRKIIADIEKHPNDDMILAKYLLTSQELAKL